MKNFLTVCLTLLINIVCIQQLSSQEKVKLINSHDLVLDGIDLYEDGRYEKAIEKFNEVDRNDSLYITALAEKGLTLMALEEYEEAIATLQLAMNATETPIPEIYINLGSALDDYGDSIAALNVYEEGIARYPKHYLLIFNKAITLNKLHRYDECIQAFKDVLDINPNHAGTHYALGTIAVQEGKVVQAMLSLNAFLMIEPASERSQNAISMLETISTGKPDMSAAKGITFSKQGDDFSDIELLIQNKVALSKKYKVKVSLNADLIKQNHLLMEKLQPDAGDKGFWMKFYVPFFKQLFEEGQFANFTYYSFLSIQNSTVQSTLNKNIKGIKSFDAWWPDVWYDLHKEHDYVLAGKKTTAQYWYSDNGFLQIVGTLKTVGKDRMLVGPYEAFNDNGCRDAIGQFDEKGKKYGECTFYDEFGRLSDRINFKDDNYHGKYTAYYENGNIASESNYKEGLLDGEMKVYYYYGGLSEIKNFKAGKLHGAYTSFYSNGGKDYETTYKEGEIDGTLTKYYPDGSKQSDAVYKAGKPNGLNTEYYRNGQIASTETYVDGEVEGSYKTYHLSGILSSEGTAKDDFTVGEYKSYFPDGKLSEQINYDESGKLNGTKKVFDRDGILFYEWDYTKGEITGYRYYDKQGKIISEGKRKLAKFPFLGYYEDGTKHFEGDYEGSEKNGIWKYYDRYGNLESEDPNKKGITDGILKEYFPNGDLESQIKFEDGLRDGYYEEYYDNGTLKEQGWYKEDMQVGNWKYYYENGNIKSHFYFVDDLQHGWQDYYDEKGKLETAYLINYDLLIKNVNYDTSGNALDTITFTGENFKLTENQYNGAVSFEGNYKNGDANGEFKWYGSGGKVKTEGNYLDDKRDGTWKWYYVNGQLETEGTYSLSKTTGQWKYYHDNGKPELIRDYYLDKQEGEFTRYYRNGQVELKGVYQDDERNGAFMYYDETGQLQIIKYFVHGKFVGYSYNGTDGKPVAMIPFVNGTGTVTAYYQNGKKSMEYTMSKGNYEGKYMEWYASGKLFEEMTYKDDDLDGERKTYYSNGKLRLEEFYKDGNLEGVTKEYTEDGKLKETNTYFMGARYGEQVFYNAGKATKTIYYYHDKIVYEK